MRNFFPRMAQLTLVLAALFTFLGTDQDSRFQALGHKVMCVCGCNQVLLECNHVGCTYSDRMRGELASYVDRGDSDDLTLQAFVQKYGPTVLIAPTTTGFNRVAWVMPYLVLVLGLTTVVLIVRTWRTRPLAIPAGVIGRASNAELERYREQARKDTQV
jgi:cytochrome c-type biogenesis protein CcmH/NrfF